MIIHPSTFVVSIFSLDSSYCQLLFIPPLAHLSFYDLSFRILKKVHWYCNSEIPYLANSIIKVCLYFWRMFRWLGCWRLYQFKRLLFSTNLSSFPPRGEIRLYLSSIKNSDWLSLLLSAFYRRLLCGTFPRFRLSLLGLTKQIRKG